MKNDSPFVLWYGMGKLDDATNCAFDVRTTKRAIGNGLSKKSITTFRYSSVSNNLPHFSGFNFRLFCTKLPIYSSRKSGGASGVVISTISRNIFFFSTNQDINLAISFLVNNKSNTCLEKSMLYIFHTFYIYVIYLYLYPITFINYSIIKYINNYNKSN